MGLLHKINRLRKWMAGESANLPTKHARRPRRCGFEEIESRRLMAADLHVGSVYYEQAAGDDLNPNIIHFTFEGGAAGTELTRIVIDGDKDGLGRSAGDIFFDTAPGGFGAFRSNPLRIISHDGFEVLNTQVVDGGMRMVIDLAGFQAGETLVISVDVDEYQFVSGDDIDINAVAEGAEFQRSKFITTFKAPHYEDLTATTLFWDAYNKNFADAASQSGSTLELPPDRYNQPPDLSDLTAGAVAVAEQVALPNSIAGVVFLDHNLNNDQDAGDPGIRGVELALLQWDGSKYVATGLTTVTDTLGRYRFDDLEIGKFRVVESQPDGYRSVGAAAGTVNGVTRGVVTTSDIVSEIELLGGEDSVHNDFAEYLPVSIGGRVHVNTTGDCEDPGNPPLAGVTIHLLDQNGTIIDTVVTDKNGEYLFDDLRPGIYGVREVQPVGYFSGATLVGSAGGDKGNDVITNVVLTSGVDAVNYDFCEIPPATISGYVYVDTNNNGIRDAGEAPIAGVTLTLKDENGQPTGATTVTDANGYYQFSGLRPGTYGVGEVQPVGYLDGLDTPGSAGGTAQNPGDMIMGAVLTGGVTAVNYNFGELLPVSISGYVHVSYTGDCEDPGNPPLADVLIELLNDSGQVVATTRTNADGYYIFDDLAPGTYSVREVQPEGYFDGGEKAGSAGGTVSDDLISNVQLVSGTAAVDYNFCEIPPAELCGYVYVDRNNNGIRDPGEEGIGGVTVHLKDTNGNLLGITAITDASGLYCFENLRPGTYGVGEDQPVGYFDGLDAAGTAGGVAMNPGDMIMGAVLTPGLHAKEYNFGELPPASLAGMVHVNVTGDCEDPGNPPLEGVTIHLLDSTGNVIAITTTNAQGRYRFANLAPGTYSVREIQPTGYFDGGEDVGSAGGVEGDDLISDIVLLAGVNAVDYDFCEIPPAALSGHVFQDGPPIPVDQPGQIPDVLALRDGQLTPDDILLPGVLLQLRDGITGLPIYGSAALPGYYAGDQPITTLTNSGGYYEFLGLPPGSYAVYEIRPEGYLPGIDTPGSTGGIVISPLVTTDPDVLAGLVELPSDDAIVQIALAAGIHSTDNNFSVVTTVPPPPIILPPLLGNPDPPPVPLLPLAPPLENPLPFLQTPFLVQPVLTRAGGQLYTWHLSVVDAGFPRGELPGAGVQLTAARPEDLVQWSDEELDEVEWSVLDDSGDTPVVRKIRFGKRGGLPVAGDFNGDGRFEIGVFIDGHWFIDLNANGKWDEGDLWAKLGHQRDQPVTGDWNGDGKTDIGIYGPAWSGDPRAIAHEPGLPDPHNENRGKHKNIPRPRHETAIGERRLKRTADGKPRSDLIDHVFFYGTPGDHAVVGDWNGDGIDTIGVFRNGMWRRDADGDGERTDRDHAHRFGQHGDKPLSGDFNGDGIEEMAIFRDGTWYIDTNNNGVIDNDDLVLKLGEAGDIPVVGDFDGDGKSEPAVYHDPAA